MFHTELDIHSPYIFEMANYYLIQKVVFLSSIIDKMNDRKYFQKQRRFQHNIHRSFHFAFSKVN